MGKFVKGQSGNPAGRAPGSRNRITTEARKLIEESTPEILAAMVDAAKGGDTAAAKMLLDRVLPKRLRSEIHLPQLNSIGSVLAALDIVAEQSANGAIDADEARALASIIESASRQIDLCEEYSGVLQAVFEEIIAESPEIARRIAERLAAMNLDAIQAASRLISAGDTP